MNAVCGHPPIRIDILALPETTPLAVYGFYEVFSAVGSLWSELTGESVKVRRLIPRIVAGRKRPFESAVGTPIAPQAGLSEAGSADVVIVTDVNLPGENTDLSHWSREVAWIRERLDAGAIICSQCTGAIFLAEAGLLNGLEAASHWSAAGLFRDRYPEVRFRPDRILCNSSHGGRLLTTGGASSWEDLALYLVTRFCGRAEAVRIAKIFVFGDRTEGQLPFAAMARPRRHKDAAIEGCQVWIADNYVEPNPVARMVARSGLPERTFKRRFKAATGYTPVDYVQALRIEEAKQLLETSRASVEDVAATVGYEDPAFFRRLFKRRAGITPAHYRQRFQQVSRL